VKFVLWTDILNKLTKSDLNVASEEALSQ
jgi:hypothetical protein